MSMVPGGGSVKFIEAGSFKRLPSPADFDGSFVMIGSAVIIADAAWRIVGSATNPHRAGELLVFVEIAPDRRIGPGDGQNRGRRATDRPADEITTTARPDVGQGHQQAPR